jgi:hypothetical protein
LERAVRECQVKGSAGPNRIIGWNSKGHWTHTYGQHKKSVSKRKSKIFNPVAMWTDYQVY